MSKQSRTPEQVEALKGSFSFNQAMFVTGVAVAIYGGLKLLGGLTADDVDMKHIAEGALMLFGGTSTAAVFKSNSSEIAGSKAVSTPIENKIKVPGA